MIKKSTGIIKRPLVIGIVAGEKSGDMLGANLISVLKNHEPNMIFIGITGNLMKAEGCYSWYDIEDLSLIGIFEILFKIPKLLKIQNDLINRFIKNKIDIFIGIDFPEFNLAIEYKLKLYGIKTVHYVSPSIWAWRYNRIFKIHKSTDLVLLLWPFEKKYYIKHNISYCYVGHFMADKILLYPNKKQARKLLKINANNIYLAILPGSRLIEINRLTKVFLRAAEILMTEFPKLKILVPIVNKSLRSHFESIYRYVFPALPITIFDGQAQNVMIAADIALLASGTATFECMLAKCPMVVGYKIHNITYWLIKRFMKTSFISLPNLLFGSQLVKEFIQFECKPELLANALKLILINKYGIQRLKKKFFLLHKILRINAHEKLIKAIFKLINQ